MPRIAYTVTVRFASRDLADEWLRWLRGGHIAEVLSAGASDAEIVEMDRENWCFEVRYHFPSPEAFALYERDHAPRLRAAGMNLFPPGRGVTYHRVVGVVLE